MKQIEIIQQVEQFYNSAWDKLIITGGVIFGVIGIIFPIVLQLYQLRSLKLQEKEIKADTDEYVKKIKEELQKEIREEFRSEIKKLDFEINKKSMRLYGMGCHLQGNAYLKDKKFVSASRDFMYAVIRYLEGEDYNNLRTVIKILMDDCFPKIKRSELNDLFTKIDLSEKDFFDKLKELDSKNYASQLIIDLKFAMNKIPASTDL